ncbi:hypothetical protein [Nostoc sp.]|uniref:hypothetical protein n=1 Tax=Nostoc sp. TaxID=1180 RepID=UPI002FFB5A92
MNKPRKKTQVFHGGQIEEYQIGLEFEQIECSLCGGSGEISDDDPDGIPYTEECSDCDGEGVVYISID